MRPRHLPLVSAVLVATACTAAQRPVVQAAGPPPQLAATAQPLSSSALPSTFVVMDSTMLADGLAADTIVEQGTLLMLDANDTLAVEHFTRVGGTTSASLAIGSELQVDYHMSVDDASGVRRLDARMTHNGEYAPRQRFSATISGDSIWSRTITGDTMRTGAGILPEGTLPYVDPSLVMLEMLVRDARSSGRSAALVPVLLLGSPSAVYNVEVTFVGDSAYVRFAGTTTRLLIDRIGRILGGVIPQYGVRILRTVTASARLGQARSP